MVTGLQWSDDVLNIKNHIIYINDRLLEEGRESRATLEDYEPWLNRCKIFTQLYGKPHVPVDIRNSINDVEHHLGLDATVWPAASYRINE